MYRVVFATFTCIRCPKFLCFYSSDCSYSIVAQISIFKKFNSNKIISYVFNIRCFSRLLKSKLQRENRVSSSCDVTWSRAVELVWYYLRRINGQRNFHQRIHYSWTFWVYVFAQADAKPSWWASLFFSFRKETLDCVYCHHCVFGPRPCICVLSVLTLNMQMSCP